MIARSAPLLGKKKIYRAVVIGCGKMGALFERDRHRPKPATHAGAIEANPRTQLAALVDVDPKTLAAAGKLFPRARCYADSHTCLGAERPDVVVLATPALSHYALTKQAIAAGARIIVCEKPLALSMGEARAIEALVKRSGTIFVLNHQRRFFETFAAVRTSIARGELGRVQQLTCYYSNGLYANGSHSLDAALYLLQDEIVAWTGHVNLGNPTHPKGDWNIDALLATRRGTTIVLQSLDQSRYVINSLAIFGEKGCVSIGEFGFTAAWYRVQPSRFANLNRIAPKSSRRVRKVESATAGALAHAIAAFERGEEPQSSAATGRRLIEVLDSLTKAAHSGRRRSTMH